MQIDLPFNRMCDVVVSMKCKLGCDPEYVDPDSLSRVYVDGEFKGELHGEFSHVIEKNEDGTFRWFLTDEQI